MFSTPVAPPPAPPNQNLAVGRRAPVSRGVEICVEALNEWRIKEIGYDGVEKYIQPMRFKELLTENAHLVDWKKLIGSRATFDDPNAAIMEEGGEEGGNTDGIPPEAEGDEQPQPAAERPKAGPWADVAKNLHQSLQEVNALLDTLGTLRRTHYLAALPTIPMDEAPHAQKSATEALKSFHLLTRKRAIVDAARAMDAALQSRRAGGGVTDDAFFVELRLMREKWRVRKVQRSIFGDLGYRIYGQKFLPDELFYVYRRQVPLRIECSAEPAFSHIEVQIPHHLMRRTTIAVSIERGGYSNRYEGGVKPETEAACRLDETIEEASPVKYDPKLSRLLHWEKAVEWAQESIICRDLFNQLVRECAADCERECMALSDDSLSVPLFGEWVLRVERQFRPFAEAVGTMPEREKGIPYLNSALRELFIAEATKAPTRNQQFIHLSRTTQSENLDLRGPQALSAEEIAARRVQSRPLLTRFIDIAGHHLLLSHRDPAANRQEGLLIPASTLPTNVVDTLLHHQIRFSDPQLQWKWIRSTPTYSVLSVVQVNRGFEVPLGKHSFQIRVSADAVMVVDKENRVIHCRRDMVLLRDALLLFTANVLLNSVAILCRSHLWQVLHANNNAVDADGNTAPTLYACNQPASKQLFVQFPTNGRSPGIFMRRGELRKTSTGEEDGGLADGSDAGGGFRRFDYDSIPGSTLMRKMDWLLGTFRA